MRTANALEHPEAPDAVVREVAVIQWPQRRKVPRRLRPVEDREGARGRQVRRHRGREREGGGDTEDDRGPRTGYPERLDRGQLDVHAALGAVPLLGEAGELRLRLGRGPVILRTRVRPPLEVGERIGHG